MTLPYTALEQDRSRREQQAGNATRPAEVVQKYETRGTGEVLTTSPIAFGVGFLNAPSVLTGAVVSRFPDGTLWQYPLISAGVYRWESETLGTQKLYTGAYMFFNVVCDPRVMQRTDGSNLAYWEDQEASLPPGSAYNNAHARANEARLAVQLKNNPPQVIVEHHLYFAGVAMQSYALSDSLNAPVTPIQPGITT